MSDEEDFEIRTDPRLAEAMARGIEQFKYLCAVAWAPIVVITPIMGAEGSQYGLFFKLLSTISLFLLGVAGSIFFLAFVKQNSALSHQLMGKKALQIAQLENPLVTKIIATNAEVSQRLGNIADKWGFPFLTIGYSIIFFLSIVSIWNS